MAYKDPEKHREYSRQYAAEHREEQRERSRRHYENNRAIYAANQRRYRQEKPENNRAKAARHRARKANVMVDSPTALREREAEISTEPCTHCGTRDRIEIDHIVPLSKGGSHAAANLQALCRSCNATKGDKLLAA